MAKRKKHHKKAMEFEHNFAPKSPQKEETKKSEDNVIVELTIEEYQGILGQLTVLRKVYGKAYNRVEDPDKRAELVEIYDKAAEYKKALMTKVRSAN